MLLVKRICQTLHKPVFEVLNYPSSELDYWSVFFSIDENNDKPSLPPVKTTLDQDKSAFRSLFQ